MHRRYVSSTIFDIYDKDLHHHDGSTLAGPNPNFVYHVWSTAWSKARVATRRKYRVQEGSSTPWAKLAGPKLAHSEPNAEALLAKRRHSRAGVLRGHLDPGNSSELGSHSSVFGIWFGCKAEGFTR